MELGEPTSFSGSLFRVAENDFWNAHWESFQSHDLIYFTTDITTEEILSISEQDKSSLT